MWYARRSAEIKNQCKSWFLAYSGILYSNDDSPTAGVHTLMQKEEIIKALRKHHQFSELTESQFSELMKQSHQVSLDQAEVLFHQGDPVSRFYFVAKGMLRLYRIAPSGHEKVIEIVRAGQCFGEALMFSEQTQYPVTSDALEPAIVVGFDNASFMNMLQTNKEVCFALMTRMSQRLHSQLNEIENLSLQNAMHRLVNYLLRSFDGIQGPIVLDVPKRHLASQLAIQPETLSRLLRKLSDAEILKIEKSNLELLDKDRLFELATDNQPLRSNT